MSGDTFIEKITVLDEWESGHKKFRLVDKGAGPKRLQIFKEDKWKDESTCYQWGVITDRLLSLKNVSKAIEKNTDTMDFAQDKFIDEGLKELKPPNK